MAGAGFAAFASDPPAAPARARRRGRGGPCRKARAVRGPSRIACCRSATRYGAFASIPGWPCSPRSAGRYFDAPSAPLFVLCAPFRWSPSLARPAGVRRGVAARNDPVHARWPGFVEAGLAGLLVLAGVQRRRRGRRDARVPLVSFWLPLPVGAIAWWLAPPLGPAEPMPGRRRPRRLPTRRSHLRNRERRTVAPSRRPAAARRGLRGRCGSAEAVASACRRCRGRTPIGRRRRRVRDSLRRPPAGRRPARAAAPMGAARSTSSLSRRRLACSGATRPRPSAPLTTTAASFSASAFSVASSSRRAVSAARQSPRARSRLRSGARMSCHRASHQEPEGAMPQVPVQDPLIELDDRPAGTERVRRARHRLDGEAPPAHVGQRVAGEEHQVVVALVDPQRQPRRRSRVAELDAREAVVVTLEVGERVVELRRADRPRRGGSRRPCPRRARAVGQPRSSRARPFAPGPAG